MNSVSQGEAQETIQLAEDLNCIFSIPGDGLNPPRTRTCSKECARGHMYMHTPNLARFIKNISMLK